MARKEKYTLDYFPHYAVQGDILNVIQEMYGNDGYAVLHKNYEQFCLRDKQYIDLSEYSTLATIAAYCKVPKDKYLKIVRELVKLGAYDMELWEQKNILISSNFIENTKDAYKKRTTETPDFEDFKNKLLNKSRCNIISADANTQIKLDEIKQDEIKENTPHNPPKNEIKETGGQDFLNFSKALSGIIEHDKLQKLHVALCQKLGNKKFVTECTNDWLLSVYNHKEKTNFPAKSLLSYARKNFKKYAVAKSSTPSVEQTREYLDEQARNKSDFNPLDLNTKEEAIRYIKKIFPPHQRGRTYGQKKLIKKFNLKPCDYSGEYVDKKGV